MTRNELIDALHTVFPISKQHAEDTIGPEMYASLQYIYINDRFDGIFDGPNRHIDFAKWVQDNQKIVVRYHSLRQRHVMNRKNKIRAEIWKLEVELERIV